MVKNPDAWRSSTALDLFTIIYSQSPTTMRRLAFLLLLGSTVFAADTTAVRVVRIWPGYRTAESFERISEYVDGQENPGRQVILRSQPSARAGYYFLTRLDSPSSAPMEVTFELQVIGPTSPETRKYTFPATLRPGSHVFNLGVTGSDWADKAAHPVAWLIVVRAADGTELVRKPSFLWTKPGKA